MKNKYFKLIFTMLVLVQVIVNKAGAQQQPVPICPCSAFTAQAVPIAANNDQCCYAIQVKQVYPANTNCRPAVIKMSPAIAGIQLTAASGWQLQSSTSTGYYFTMTPASGIPSSAVWNTVATICTPKCTPLPEIIIEWMKDIDATALCKASVSASSCPAASCDLSISNTAINCTGTSGNYTVTYTMKNNSCVSCNASVTLNSAYNILQAGTSPPPNQVIPVGGSITQTINVTATPGSNAFYMNACCFNAAGSGMCCVKDSIPWPACITCDTAHLSADNMSFCDKGATTLRALYSGGTPVSTTNIKWYRAQAPCPPAPTDPSGNLAPGWTLFQSSGNTATTSSPLLTASTCYIAYINENANCNYWTSPITITVNKTPVITTIQDKETCDPNMSTAVRSPSQSFYVPIGAGQSVQWLQSSDCISFTPVPPASVINTPGVSIFNTGGLNGSTTANPCDTVVYCYRVVLSSINCGTATKDFRVKVFSLPNVGSLTAFPASVCNGKAATISRLPGCGKIVRWEKSGYSSSPGNFSSWTDITSGYGTANNFSTNNLYNSGNCVLYIAYRVTIENGACSPPYTDTRTVIVQVLPDLKPVISVPGGAICMGPMGINLTCRFPVCASPLYPLPPVTYTWFRNSPASGVNGGSVFHASTPGTYWVTASNSCGSWTSAPVTICARPVVTLPPGCICRRPPANTPYKLAVQITGGCSNCTYTIIWRERKNGPWIFTGTATGLTAGTNMITIPASKLPPLTYGEQLHFQVRVISTSCGTSCLPALSNINTVTVCPQ